MQYVVYFVQPLPHFLLRVVNACGKLPFYSADLLATHHPGNIIEDHRQVAQSKNDPQDYERLVHSYVSAFEVTFKKIKKLFNNVLNKKKKRKNKKRFCMSRILY